jgi:hypothetical protein
MFDVLSVHAALDDKCSLDNYLKNNVKNLRILNISAFYATRYPALSSKFRKIRQRFVYFSTIAKRNQQEGKPR